MDKKKISAIVVIDAIKKGNYKIKHETECGCCIDWKIKDRGLEPDISSDCCYIGNILSITRINPKTKESEEVDIARYIQFEGWYDLIEKMYISNWNDEVIEEYWDIEELLNNMGEHDIISNMYIGEMEENEEHNNKLAESLKNFITENEYTCYIYYPRNFANEYDCILVSKDADIDNLPEDAEQVTVEEFAERYLEKDNDCTKYYKGFGLIE